MGSAHLPSCSFSHFYATSLNPDFYVKNCSLNIEIWGPLFQAHFFCPPSSSHPTLGQWVNQQCCFRVLIKKMSFFSYEKNYGVYETQGYKICILRIPYLWERLQAVQTQK